MSNLDKAIERIKALECPTGDLENRVAGILEEYGAASRDAISVNKDDVQSKDGLETYSAVISGNKEQHIKVLAKSGLDDYVATVVEAFII